MRITVIGTGYVGTVTGACLAYLGHRVTCVDTDRAKIEKLRIGEMPNQLPEAADVCRRLEGIISFGHLVSRRNDHAAEHGVDLAMTRGNGIGGRGCGRLREHHNRNGKSNSHTIG